MGPPWITVVLLASLVTCSLVAADPSPADCSLPSSLNATKVSELLRNYTDQNNNSGVTVLQLVQFSINTTGDRSLTKSKLNWQDSCFDHFKFTLRQVALMNEKVLDEFPGNATMNDVLDLLFSNATKTVVQDVNQVLESLRNRSVNLDRKLDFFIQDVGFVVKKASFLSILSYALNSTDYDATVVLLDYNQELLNVTLVQMAEYLFLTSEELQKNLTLESVVRYLSSSKTFLRKLQVFLKREKESLAARTVMDLVNSEDTNILTAIKMKYQGYNLTFFQFFWERRVEMSAFDFKIEDLSLSTSIKTAVIKNYTITELFEFLFKYSELVTLHTKSLHASKAMREKILRHYKVANISVLSDHFNVTSGKLERLTDMQFEGYAMKYYIYRYVVVQLNTTFEETEMFAKLENGSLKNASFETFPELMAKIGVAYAVKVLNESKVLRHLLNDHSALHLYLMSLKRQIEIDRQPLTKNVNEIIVEFEVSYIIFQYGISAVSVYEQTVFNFTKEVQLNWQSFLTLFNLIMVDRNRLNRFYMENTFEEISMVLGIRLYIIFGWKFEDINARLLYLIQNNVNECTLNRNSCPGDSQCVDNINGYTCKCTTGLNVDPDNKCRDVNECKLVEPKNAGCSNHSHCVNTYGSFRCVCDKGYEKDEGGNCVDKNECASGDKCSDPNAVCRNLPGSYECICTPGTTYDFTQHYCKDIDECVTERACSDISNSTCKNKGANEGRFECNCKPGFNATYNGTGSARVLLNCTDVDECSRPDLNRCHRHAQCNNTIGNYRCTCKKGYTGDGFSCREYRLVDLSILRLTIIRRTVRVRPFLGFYFGGKMHTKIYISTNGLISLGKKYTRSTPKSCKNGRLKKDIVAPFWASSTGGTVRYQQFAKEEEGSTAALERVNEIVGQTTGFTEFEANWALVVSWEKIMPKYCFFLCWGYRDETNTFQAVLATNGSTSVVMFLYEDNGMSWFRQLGRKALVGYATRQGACKEFEGSLTNSIFDIDSQSFSDPAGTSRRGVIVLVFSKGNEPETPEEKCLRWIRNQPQDNDWLEALPSCPCTQRGANADERFDEISRDSSRVCYVFMKDQRREYTKTCCYFRFGFWRRGALITSGERAGRAARYSPSLESSSHEEHDVEPYKMCCSQSSKYCNDFSQYRPVETSCSNQPPAPCSCRWIFGFRIVIIRRRRRRWWRRSPRRGWFFGDPHITTLDGFKYSFNGLGEYVLLTTADESHILHARTVRPPHKDGGESNATVFSGFAMKNNKNTTVQVLFSDSMSGNLSILVRNPTNVCQSFDINNLKQSPGFYLKRKNDTLVVMFDSGFAVEITPGIGLLQIAFSVPPELADKNTTGLLGVLNGNQTDDLTHPNGTVLPIGSTDKEIFNYGQTWKVPDDKGLFMFENCSKQSVFFDGSFTPMFLSDYNISAINQSIVRDCNNNKQCILDVLLTGNRALGLATLNFEVENDKRRDALDNQPPDISFSHEVANVTVNQQINITVTVEDPNDGDTYTLSNSSSLPDGAVFNNRTGVLSWTPVSGQQDQDFKLEFAAVDSKGASQVKSIEVKFCDCKNGQACDFTNVLKSKPNNNLEVVGCNCSAAYSGDYCETDVDPCADEPCYANVNCSTRASPFGYQCGPCPGGLVGNGEDCNDFDECSNSTANNCTVNQRCINTLGSYRCECKPGYIPLPGQNCTDVNECHAITGNNDCGANTVCTNRLGGYNCSCKEGYEGDPKTGCTDVNECLQNGRCNHNCQNTAGSFKCTCRPGYKLNETMPNHYTCLDVDECLYLINHDCEQECSNTLGSYRCGCRRGYNLAADNKTCTANDTCALNHGCQGKCIKMLGEDKCECPRGYKLSNDNKTCEEINECVLNIDGCAQNCSNAPGNYSCSCQSGYKLATNKRDCEDIDDCKVNKGGCDHKCTNTKGGRTCSCKRGYELNDDKKTCKDIDECKSGRARCAKGQNCRNKMGGYKCRCSPGKFSDGKFECKKSKRFRLKLRILKYLTKVLQWRSSLEDEFSEDYQYTSVLIIVQINTFFNTRYGASYFGCRVLRLGPGSIIANVSVDFDPNSNVSVDALNNEVNRSNGVMGDLRHADSSVTDFDECSDPEENNCHSNAKCTNVPGSFTCQCNDGYEGDGVNCEAKRKKTDSDKTALIVGICIAVAVVVIVIIVIILCCLKREKKGGIRVTENEGNGVPVHTWKPKNGEVYYDDEKKGRRGSDESIEGDYDVAGATNVYYDNPGMKKDEETAM